MKVFRTPIGFHDAFVAATSRAAALRAWGSDVDLFARGLAEEVTDTALARAPLAAPGTVIRVARGTAAEHLAALPATPKKPRPSSEPAPPRKRTPPPSKADLTAAQDAAAEARAAFEERERDLSAREAALARERRALERDRTRDLASLQARVDEEEDRYRRALADWEP